MREERTEVLVVGAGPVGLWTALVLNEAGLQVRIIDREPRTATRSYACALHPGTLRKLRRFGLDQPLLAQAARISKMGLYDQKERRAGLEIKDPEYPFLAVVPQSALEDALERRLAQTGIRVRWNHRFDSLQAEPERVAAIVEELAGTAIGYIVPHWEVGVKERFPIRAEFLVGADGYHSLVRQRAEIPFRRLAGPEFFAAYEFLANGSPDATGEGELKIVFTPENLNFLWPLPEGKFRWTFQFTEKELPSEFPDKDRRATRVSHAPVDERIREFVRKTAKQRAPWFTEEVKELTWCTRVPFERGVVSEFNRGRVCLVGDAAHQTGPAGVQSMNAGFEEADALARVLGAVQRSASDLSALQAWSREQTAHWDMLLGASGGLKPGQQTDPWLAQAAPRLLACLPATGDRLRSLAGQLGLELA